MQCVSVWTSCDCGAHHKGGCEALPFAKAATRLAQWSFLSDNQSLEPMVIFHLSNSVLNLLFQHGEGEA